LRRSPKTCEMFQPDPHRGSRTDGSVSLRHFLSPGLAAFRNRR
jgi:hypothetical protein